MSYRILVTGARDWDSPIAVRTALDLQGRLSRHAPNEVIVVHGGARGADVMAHEGAKALGCQVEVHLAADHPDPLARNQHMVDLGADICLAFATRWASGTGHCARAARRAGIHVIDMGVSTRIEDRP